jgi:hypothetical protein
VRGDVRGDVRGEVRGDLRGDVVVRDPLDAPEVSLGRRALEEGGLGTAVDADTFTGGAFRLLPSIRGGTTFTSSRSVFCPRFGRVGAVLFFDIFFFGETVAVLGAWRLVMV